MNATWNRWDLLIALGFALLGAIVGARVLGEFGKLFYYQTFMPELVYSACGYGFSRPAKIPQVVIDFLFDRTTTLDCASLGEPVALGPEGLFIQVHTYLALAIAGIWRVLGIDNRNLWPLVSLLSGAYAGGCFVLLRLFFWRILAIIGGIVLTLSPVGLSMIFFLRDYAKAPFFIWVIVFLVLAVRTRDFQMMIFWSVLAGITVGVGYGFRSDVIILLPVGIVFLAIALPGWKVRVSAVAVFIIISLSFAAPMLATRTEGGFGFVLLEGLSEPFRAYLDLGPTPYMFGPKYSDEFTYSSIVSDLNTREPNWNKQEGFASQAMIIKQSGAYVLNWISFFSGDVVTQAMKSAAWIIGFPALVAESRRGFDPGVTIRAGPASTKYLDWLYNALARSWLPFVCMLGLAAFFWRLMLVNLRETIALFLMLGGLLFYPIVQFSVRHVFHLEFIWVAAALALVALPYRLITLPRAALKQATLIFAGSGVAGIILVIGIRYALTIYQDSALRREFSSLLVQPRELVTTSTSTVRSDGKALLNVPVPEQYRSMIDGPADSLMTNFDRDGVEWIVRSGVDRLLLTVGGQGCHSKKITLSFDYAKRDSVWQPFDQDIVVDLPHDQIGRTTVLVPAFYRPSQYLARVQVPEDAASCVSKIERLKGPTKLPAILSAILAPGWQTQPLHRSLGGFPVGE